MPDSLWPLVGIPALIFLARMSDVTLGTLRIIFVSRGLVRLAPFVGFVEVLVWLVAITQVLQHLDHPVNYVAYAAGFATGTWAGIQIEARLGLGLMALRVITDEDASELTEALRAARFGVTTVAARGIRGKVRLLFTILQRNDLERALEIVRDLHPSAFVSISDVREASEGFIMPRRSLLPGRRQSK
ncbi:MAG TPA: DUF2179 domain-containing protein [Thermoanaerobaculia bacterium]|nr:DUF2179 domain-containing protein [Thermoanaerobaculia bacterium]